MFYDYRPIYCNDFKRPRNLSCIRINVHHDNYKQGLKNESLYKFSKQDEKALNNKQRRDDTFRFDDN